MPASPHATLLCSHRYDPRDRLVNSAPTAMEILQRFYCRDRLTTEIQGAVRYSVFQHEDRPLAQRRDENTTVDTALLATDQKRSVLNSLAATGTQPAAYTPYGHRSGENGLLSLLGFNGERRDPLTGHYSLGNGYRQFNPVLMRFNSPDSWSPFGDGGLNAYGYCVGDPVNRSDPTGHFSLLKSLVGVFGGIAVGAGIGSLVAKDEKAKLFFLVMAAVASTVAMAGTIAIAVKALRPVGNGRSQPRSRATSMQTRRGSEGSQPRSSIDSVQTQISLGGYDSSPRSSIDSVRYPFDSPPAYTDLFGTSPYPPAYSPMLDPPPYSSLRNPPSSLDLRQSASVVRESN